MTDKTFVLDDLFKFSSNFNAEFDGFALTIDNFYENAEDLHDWIQNRQYPMWKYSTERPSRNGIDYNDCRITDKIAHPTRIYETEMDRLLNICRKYFHKGEYNWDRIYEFNCFQTLSVFDNAIQHYPHTDSELDTPDDESTLNMIVYMDKQESGGTAVYNGTWLSNDEHLNVLYPVEERFEIERIIPAKFNRCVIFPGNRIHGAWIEDYNKYTGDSWRFTQATFFHPNRSWKNVINN
jgi:hypothetical protein